MPPNTLLYAESILEAFTGGSWNKSPTKTKVFHAKGIASEHPNISRRHLWVCSNLTLDTTEISPIIIATSSEYSNLSFALNASESLPWV